VGQASLKTIHFEATFPQSSVGREVHILLCGITVGLPLSHSCSDWHYFGVTYETLVMVYASVAVGDYSIRFTESNSIFASYGMLPVLQPCGDMLNIKQVRSSGVVDTSFLLISIVQSNDPKTANYSTQAPVACSGMYSYKTTLLHLNYMDKMEWKKNIISTSNCAVEGDRSACCSLVYVHKNITVFILKLLFGAAITLDVDPSDSIENVKTTIQNKEGNSILSDQQHINIIVFDGQQLEDGCTLIKYYVRKGNALHLVTGPCSGMQIFSEDSDRKDHHPQS
jgi:hypothetical protein